MTRLREVHLKYFSHIPDFMLSEATAMLTGFISDFDDGDEASGTDEAPLPEDYF